MSLLDEVLDRHGGLDRWHETAQVKARVRSGGLLLRTKVGRSARRALSDYEIRVAVDEPRASFIPYPSPGRRGVWASDGVRIETDQGIAVAERRDPRRRFSGLVNLRRQLRWDDLDILYFAGYAMWNYLTTPYLLTRDGIQVREGEPWREPGESADWRRLEVSFPPGLDTHSAEQTFYADADGLLRRHDYTAEPVGSWARAAHYLDDHVEAGGLTFPTRRRVRPVGPRNRSLPLPTLVSIDLDDVDTVNV
jgi:hypothetical protein